MSHVEDDDQAGALLPFDDGSAGRLIRRQWHHGAWYFSVIDAVALLTDSPTPRRYWSDLKRKLEAEGAQLYANIVQLKMRAFDGKLRPTDAADTETMLRIVQSIPSPKAEPFKQWLAREGALSLGAVADALPSNQARLLEHSVMTNADEALLAAARMANVIGSRDVAVFRDEGYLGLYGESAEQIAARKGVPVAAIGQWMSRDEQAYNIFRATLARQQIEREQPRTRADANEIHYDVGRGVRHYIIDEGATLPELMPTPEASISQLERAERYRLQQERREAKWQLEGDVE